MGTSWTVRLAGSQALAEGLRPAIEAELALVINQMSNWEAASDISRFNRAAGPSWHVLQPAFFEVLTAALDVARESGGAFDPTIGALVDRWGFGPEPWGGEAPSVEEIETLFGKAGWQRLEIDRPAQRALQPGGLALDFSGIAKGHAVDRIAALPRTRGVRHFLAEIGGELVGEGVKPEGEPWWVDVEPPPGSALPLIRIALHGVAVATSGDYRRFLDRDGRRLAHSIDPRTGRPIDNGVASVTMVHESCMMADAYATALTVLGPDEGMAFAEAHGLACHMVVREQDEFGERISPAFAEMLE